MELYELMKNYAQTQKIAYADNLPNPELGKSLSLFHSCLMESGLEYLDHPENKQIISPPMEIQLTHLSRFVVGFLPFNSISTKKETNEVLFDLYLFFRWLDNRDIEHGLRGADMEKIIFKLVESQNRCLQVSHFLDEETGRILKDIDQVVETINDIFRVVKIENDFIHIQGSDYEDPIRIRLPQNILDLIQLNDSLDLVLGDTSDKWVILEAGQVYPELGTRGNPASGQEEPA